MKCDPWLTYKQSDEDNVQMNAFGQAGIYEEIHDYEVVKTKPPKVAAQPLQPLAISPPAAQQPLPPAGNASGDYTLTTCAAYTPTTYPPEHESSREGGYANFPTTLPAQNSSSSEGGNADTEAKEGQYESGV